MNNVNENIFATPKVFLFSFFKPKTYARTILETKGKISKVNIAITLIAWFVFLPLLYIYQLKGLNISFQLLIIAYIMYASVTITLLTYIFSQESFVNNELEKLIAEGKIESDYWHKSVGVFQICFVLLNPIVIAIFITVFLTVIKCNVLIGTIFWCYGFYVALQIQKIIFFKKNIIEAFFWFAGNTLLALIYFLLSIFGLFAIPYLLFKLKNITNFYPSTTFQKRNFLLRKVILFFGSFTILPVGLILLLLAPSFFVNTLILSNIHNAYLYETNLKKIQIYKTYLTNPTPLNPNNLLSEKELKHLTIIFGTNGDDLIDTRGIKSKGVIVFGLDGDDVLLGTRLDDNINGQEGNDLIIGCLGMDTLNGALGDDILIGDNAEGKTASETEKELYGSCTLEGLFERVDISTMKRVPWYIKEISTMKSVGNQQ